MSSRVETFILRLFRVIILCVTCFVVSCSRSHLSWVWMRDCVRWNKAGHIQTEDRKGERAHSFTHNTCTQYSSSLPMIYIHAHKLRTAHCACYRTTGTNMFLDICMHTHTMWLKHTRTRCERTRLRPLFCDVFIYFLHTHFSRCSYHLHGHRMYDVDGDDDASTTYSFASQFVCCFMFMWIATQTAHIRQSFLLFSSRILMQNIPLIDFTVCLIFKYMLTMRHHDQTNRKKNPNKQRQQPQQLTSPRI